MVPTEATREALTPILVLAAHPHLEHSRINVQMMRSAAASALADRVQVRDLYALYPDYLIDVAAEQQALAAAQLVVWLQPLHWYGMTPLLKLWVDEVFAFGWAYGPGGSALAGKDLWLVTSTGGGEDSYRPQGTNRHFFDAFLPPYEQTAALVGMRFLPPLLLHGAHRIGEQELAAHAQVFGERLASYPEWPEMDELSACEVLTVDSTDRPT
jgi:glutathione-regulated potassium-efflux system ancillary protein KefF